MMTLVSARWRLVLAASSCVFVLALATHPLTGVTQRSDVTDPRLQTAGLDDLVRRFYATQAAGDVEGFAALWAPGSPDLAERRAELRRILAIHGRLELGDLQASEVASGTDRATVRLTVTLLARDPKTGAVAPGFGTLGRIVEFTSVEGAWRVAREYSADDVVVDAIEKAASADARAATIDGLDRDVLPGTLLALGRRVERLLSRGNGDQGLALAEAAERVADRLGDGASKARALLSLGNWSRFKGDDAAALERYAKGLGLSESASDADLQAAFLNNIGIVRMRRSEHRLAREAFERSIALREAAGYGAATAGTLGNLANLHYVQGDFDGAAQYQQKALALAEALENTGLAATTLSNLGAIEHERGRFRRAIAYYERALAIAQSQGTKSTVALALNNIGLAHRQQGEFELARDFLNRSLAIRESLGDARGVASTLSNLGSVARMLGDAGAALDYFEKSLATQRALNDATGEALTLNSIGLAYASQERHELALEHFERSRAIAERLGNKAREVQALGNAAVSYNALGEYAKALDAADRTATLARSIGSSQPLWGALVEAGRAQRSLGRPGEARVALQEAVEILDGLRGEAGATLQAQQRFLETRISPYTELADLLADRGDAAGALAYAERAKARVLLDVLEGGRVDVTRSMTPEERDRERALKASKSAANDILRRERARAAPDAARLGSLEGDVRKARLEYEAFQVRLYAAHPELEVRRGAARSFALGDAKEVVADGRTAIVEFLVTGQRTLAFVLTGTGNDAAGPSTRDGVNLRAYTVPLAAADVTARVSEFRTKIAARDLGIREAARTLFDTLFGPARAELEAVSTLIVVPDGALWELPFQALQPAPNRYLIEDRAVALAPSLTVLREMRADAGRRVRTGRPTVLAMGNPSLPAGAATRASAMMPGALGALPEAERQVLELRQLYGATANGIYTGRAAGEARFKAEAGRHRVLHLATHGVLDDRNPMYSYLLLAPPGPGESEDGLLETWELMSLDLDADVVVLSACETARGRIGAGEGIIGLAWAAFVAGSPATVVSQWKVQSNSTADLMVAFHRNLVRATPTTSPFAKARALQRAALEVLKHPSYRHPFYWAPFVLIGDPS